MIYTKEQLEAMSEPCITIAICELRKIKHEECDGIVFGAGNVIGGNVVAVMAPIDFCNNPSDMMPLAFECGISLVKVSDGYVAFGDDYGYLDSQGTDLSIDSADDAMSWSNGAVGHKNPLRAAAIVYILIKQGE